MRGKLGGHIKGQLIRDLALGEESTTALGEKYGVSHQAISQFAQRNKLDIERAKNAMDNEFAALWVADKFNRVAEYQGQIERIAEMLDDPEIRSSVPTAEMIRTVQSALKSVAEELGQLPNRSTIQFQGTSVNYIVEGVDPETLR